MFPYYAGHTPDLLAGIITILMTSLMLAGVKKSLLFNNVLNCLNFAVWVFIMGAGLFFVNSDNWTQHGGFLPYGWSGVNTIRDIHCSLEFLSNTAVSDEDEVFPPESLDIPTAGNNGSEVAMDSTEEPSAAGETSTPTLLPTTRFLPVNTMSNSVQHLVVSEPQVSGHYQPKATTLVDVHAACTAANRQADEPSQGATPTTATRAATPVLTPDSARTSQATVKSTNIAAAAEDSAAAVDDSISSVDCGSLELKADAKHDDTNQRYPLTCKVCAEMYKMRDAHEKRLEELEAQIGALSVRLDRASDGRRLSEVTKRISTLEFRINEAAKKNEALQTLVTALSGHAVAAGPTGDSMVTEDGTSSAPSESEGENQMSSETELHHSAMTLNDATNAGVDKQGNALQDDRPQDAGTAINNTNNVTAHTDTQCDEVPSKTSSGVTHMSIQEIHVPVAAKKLTHEDVQIRPPRGITREVIIAGDGNVLRIARALIEEVQAPQSMEFITNRGATTEVLAGAATCFYAFIGFDIIATTGEEAENPKWSIPTAIILSLAIVLTAYITSSMMVTLIVPYSEINSGSGLVEMFAQRGAPSCHYIVAVGALAGLVVSMLGSMFPMPRVVYAMAKDGLIFRALAKVWPVTETPAFATLLLGGATAVVSVVMSLDVLVEMMSIGKFLPSTFTRVPVNENKESKLCLP
ncbi:hypothetical protein ISCGN_025134 [Ixodes scapularis]